MQVGCSKSPNAEGELAEGARRAGTHAKRLNFAKIHPTEVEISVMPLLRTIRGSLQIFLEYLTVW